MNKHPMSRFGSPQALGLVALGLSGAAGGCGTATSSPTTGEYAGSSSSGAASVGYEAGSLTGTNPDSSIPGAEASGGSSSGSGDDASDEPGPAQGDDAAGQAEGAADDGAAALADAQGCARGQVPPSKVVVLGDSYLDHPAWSNVIPFLYADLRGAGSLGATATYREYQLGGAAMNYGAANLNIPYQYDTSAKHDLSVMNPADIDTIIMDGGGNDIIIDNRNCLTDPQPPPADTACASTIQGTMNRASMLLQEMASDGVKRIVFVFYPHLDPAGGGLLPAPAPQVNALLDYAYPLAEQICCGSSFTATATQSSCSGNTLGTQCVFIDTRPAFEGHVADYIKSDHVHPTDAGAKVIADLIDGAMRDYCIAQ